MVTKNKIKGFTIVELLIVIVVIGILAAITLVSFNGVTQRATKAANQSNAQSVIAAAESIRANSGVYPTPLVATGVGSYASPTMLWNLNNYVVSSAGVANTVIVPSSLSSLVTGTSTGVLAGVLPTATNGNLLYVTTNATIASANGICVYYYDTVNNVMAAYTSGIATAAGTMSSVTTTALATCV